MYNSKLYKGHLKEERRGTERILNLLYNDEMVSVRPSFMQLTQSYQCAQL